MQSIHIKLAALLCGISAIVTAPVIKAQTENVAEDELELVEETDEAANALEDADAYDWWHNRGDRGWHNRRWDRYDWYNRGDRRDRHDWYDHRDRRDRHDWYDHRDRRDRHNRYDRYDRYDHRDRYDWH